MIFGELAQSWLPPASLIRAPAKLILRRTTCHTTPTTRDSTHISELVARGWSCVLCGATRAYCQFLVFPGVYFRGPEHMEGYPLGNFPTPTPLVGSVSWVLRQQTKTGRMRQRERAHGNADNRNLSEAQHCEIESTLSAEDNLSIFTQRLVYQCIPDNVQLLAQDKLSCRWPLRAVYPKSQLCR